METIPEHSAFSLSREYTNLNSFTTHKIFAQKLTPSGANTFLCKVVNRNTKIWLLYTQLDKNAQNYILVNDIPEAGKQLRAKYNKQIFSITTKDCPSDVINKQLLSFTHKCVPYTCIEVPINANNALTHHTVNSVQQVFHYIVSLWFNDNSLYINNDITHLKTVLNKLHDDKSEYTDICYFSH